MPKMRKKSELARLQECRRSVEPAADAATTDRGIGFAPSTESERLMRDE